MKLGPEIRTVTRLHEFGESHFTAAFGVNYVRAVVENQWQSSFHKIDEGDDLGLDGFIELLKNRKSTDKLLGVQIKAGPSHARWVGNEIHLDVQREHANYWTNFQVPILFFWVDDRASPPKAYWTIIAKDLKKSYVTLLGQNTF